MRLRGQRDFVGVSYSLVGWWLIDVLLVLFWILPLLLALVIGGLALLSAVVLSYTKERWSGERGHRWVPTSWSNDDSTR